jgi:hypothetical protein
VYISITVEGIDENEDTILGIDSSSVFPQNIANLMNIDNEKRNSVKSKKRFNFLSKAYELLKGNDAKILRLGDIGK